MSPSQPRPGQGHAAKSRRGFLWGAAAASAAGAAAVALPTATEPATAEATPAAEPPARGGGYRLSEHVKQYYRTTLV